MKIQDQKVMKLNGISERLHRLRSPLDTAPDISIVIPVNAQGDLQNVLHILGDVAEYRGNHSLEVIFMINNYPPQEEPLEIEMYRRLGVKVVSAPSVRRAGEAIGFTARMRGVQAASAKNAILFDADCRIRNPTALIDWYIRQFEEGAQLAYTHVEYYDLLDAFSVRTRIQVHHLARWVKRAIFRIPTTRGSNYALCCEIALQLYDRGMLADEMNVGPNFKAIGARVAYSGAKELTVLTSARMLTAGWKKVIRYNLRRLDYNLRVLPVRSDVSRRTKRENDPVRKFVNNSPVK